MISRTRLLLLMALLALPLSQAQAANWQQPVAALARKIAALTGPGQVQMVVKNSSNLKPDEVLQIEALLKRELSASGVSQGGVNSATQVTVTLSENVRGGLWVAQVQEGTDVQVAMLPVKLESGIAAATGPRIRLKHTVVIQEPEAILDAQVIAYGSAKLLVVLEGNRILVYQQNAEVQPSIQGTDTVTNGSEWVMSQSFPIPGGHAFPRDVRGRVVAGQEHLFDAYLPGMRCVGANGGQPIQVTCSDSDDPWPVTATQKAFYDSSRDYFMGVLVPGVHLQLAPFYEAAEIPRAGGPAMLLNNVDGTATLIENSVGGTVSGTEDWGSDLAAIHSTCGSGAQVVVSGSGAATASDSLRAYEIAGREAIPVSAPLHVPGTVMAIWPSEEGGDAMAVVRMADGSGYEVWSVAASCR
jgi:hypothetical protein